MPGVWEILVMATFLLTGLVAGFNALYFATQSWASRRKRVGALVLVLVNAGILVQSLGLGLVLFRLQTGTASWVWLAAEALVCLGTVLVTLLILRSWLAPRR